MCGRQPVVALALTLVTILFARGAAQAGGYRYYHGPCSGYLGGDCA
jgi:hypothetical protein